jgi:hypothetical protein
VARQSPSGPSIDDGQPEIEPRLATGLVESFMEQVRAYAALRTQMGTAGIGWRWSSGQEICLAEGGLNRDGEPTLVGEPLSLPRGVGSGSPKSCWANAWALARSSSRRGGDEALRPGRFVYVEGFAASLLPSGSGLAVAHAWCLDRRTMRVVDPTWGSEAMMLSAEAQVYLGIAFSPDFVEQAIFEANGSVRARARHISIFESDHRRECRALRLGFRYGIEPALGAEQASVGLPLVVDWGTNPDQE